MYAICVEYYGNYGAIVPAGNNGLQKNFTIKQEKAGLVKLNVCVETQQETYM